MILHTSIFFERTDKPTLRGDYDNNHILWSKATHLFHCLDLSSGLRSDQPDTLLPLRRQHEKSKFEHSDSTNKWRSPLVDGQCLVCELDVVFNNTYKSAQFFWRLARFPQLILRGYVHEAPEWVPACGSHSIIKPKASKWRSSNDLRRPDWRNPYLTDNGPTRRFPGASFRVQGSSAFSHLFLSAKVRWRKLDNHEWLKILTFFLGLSKFYVVIINCLELSGKLVRF